MWVRSIKDRCKEFNVPFFFKSWGEHCYPIQMSQRTYKYFNSRYKFQENNCFNKSVRTGKKMSSFYLDTEVFNDVPVVGNI